MTAEYMPHENRKPVQEAWPELTCYGCGPGNPDGLRLESYLSDDGRSLVATFEPEARFNVIPGVVYGGLIASLIDCQSMWTAMYFANVAGGRPPDSTPAYAYATGELRVSYLELTPLGQQLHIKSWIEGKVGRKTRVLTELGPKGSVTATGDVLAIVVDAITPPGETPYA